MEEVHEERRHHLDECQAAVDHEIGMLPMQSGVGDVGNSMVAESHQSALRKAQLTEAGFV